MRSHAKSALLLGLVAVLSGNASQASDKKEQAAAPASKAAPAKAAASAESLDGDAALRKLLAGNIRYVKGKTVRHDTGAKKRAVLAEGQAPFAVILGCADSRVPPELLFDQGLGDLFVVRVAGNIPDDAILGSIEYAVEHLHSKLIVVLGHEKCGAVKATLDGGEAPGHLPALIKTIQPAADEAKKAPGDPLDNAIAANVRATVDKLKTCSPILDKAYRAKELKVVGARYDLDRGAVEIIW